MIRGKPPTLTWRERVEIMRERRVFRRFNSIFDISYTKVEGCFTLNSLSVTQDIGFKGISTLLSKLVKKGDDILVEISNIYDNKTIAVLAKVVWLEPDILTGHNRCGLKFLWLSSESTLSDCIEYVESISDAA